MYVDPSRKHFGFTTRVTVTFADGYVECMTVAALNRYQQRAARAGAPSQTAPGGQT
jgi:hypothetical protein